MESLPVRGAWIEMLALLVRRDAPTSLPVRGAWIEITSPMIMAIWSLPSRERGLKFNLPSVIGKGV